MEEIKAGVNYTFLKILFVPGEQFFRIIVIIFA
jgi:hypothetical protein